MCQVEWANEAGVSSYRRYLHASRYRKCVSVYIMFWCNVLNDICNHNEINYASTPVFAISANPTLSSYHFQKNLDTWIQHWMVLYVDEFVAQRVIVMSEWRETALSKQYAFHAWCSSCRALWGHLISWCQCGTASTDVNTHRNKWNFTKPWAFYFDLLDVEFFTSACKLHYQKGRPLRLNK